MLWSSVLYGAHTHTYIPHNYSKNKMHLFSSSSAQFSSVAQLCPTLCDPMNRSTPGLPVHHQLPEFTQTHVHRVSDAIQTAWKRGTTVPFRLLPPCNRQKYRKFKYIFINDRYYSSTGVSQCEGNILMASRSAGQNESMLGTLGTPNV